METVISTIRELWSYFSSVVRAIGVMDILDIIIVSVLLYYLVRFIQQRRAGRLAIGVLVLLFMLIISTILNMHMIRYILENLFQVGIIALMIVFQPELRSALEKVGAEPFRGLRGIGEGKESDLVAGVIREVSSAAADMAAEKTGALIVFERTVKLGDIARTGTIINADVNAFLLKNIFFNKAPMHDGAVIISNNRIEAAGCFLPLSMNQDIIKDLGTRHRAGIGMSENSDAIVVIVSEETGVISVAVEGRLTRDYDKDTLSRLLTHYLAANGVAGKRKFRLKRTGKVSEKKRYTKDDLAKAHDTVKPEDMADEKTALKEENEKQIQTEWPHTHDEQTMTQEKGERHGE